MCNRISLSQYFPFSRGVAGTEVCESCTRMLIYSVQARLICPSNTSTASDPTCTASNLLQPSHRSYAYLERTLSLSKETEGLGDGDVEGGDDEGWCQRRCYPRLSASSTLPTSTALLQRMGALQSIVPTPATTYRKGWGSRAWRGRCSVVSFSSLPLSLLVGRTTLKLSRLTRLDGTPEL